MTTLQGSKFVGLTLCVLVASGCATVKEADSALKEWTSQQFRSKDSGEGKEADGDAKTASDDTKSDAADQQADASQAGQAPANEGGAVEDPEVPAPTGTNSAAAEALFESGHEAMNTGDYDTACARFKESNRLEPAVGAVLNLGVCEEKRGRLATAWQLYKQVMSQLPAGDDRYPIAQRRASALRPRVPRVTLELAPSAPKDTSVVYEDVVFGPASFNVPLPMDPGPHTLIVRAHDYKDRSYDFKLAEAENKELVIEPGEKK